jgi:hypothetical protein
VAALVHYGTHTHEKEVIMNNDNIIPTLTPTLSDDDVKFLRWARKQSRASVYVQWTPHTQEGYAKVTVEVRREVPGATEAVYSEHNRVLPLTGWVERYSRNDGPCTFSGLDMSPTSYYGHTGTILNLLDVGAREGDTLRVYFVIANDSDNLRNAGLSHDQCYLTLERKGSRKGQFLVDDRIHRLGDTAGMEHAYVAPPTVTVVA